MILGSKLETLGCLVSSLACPHQYKNQNKIQTPSVSWLGDSHQNHNMSLTGKLKIQVEVKVVEVEN
jgi:hypothetical protein